MKISCKILVNLVFAMLAKQTLKVFCLEFPLVKTLCYSFRQSRAQVIAISLETAIQVKVIIPRSHSAGCHYPTLNLILAPIQNAAIGYVVLNLTFESPYSDMGVIPVLSFLFFSTGSLLCHPTVFLIV